jgi:hypothetical protein
VDQAIVLRNGLVASAAGGTAEIRDLLLTPGDGASRRYEMDLQDHTVLPALINAHDHLHRNAVPPLKSGPFANSYAWAAAFRSHFDDPEVKTALAVPAILRHWQGGLKNALCGATTVMHHDSPSPILEHPHFPVRTLRPYGWAHSLHLEFGPPVAQSFQATPPNVAWFIHLAEGVDDVAAAELQELVALECLRENTVLIHGVGLSDADIGRVRAAGASVVWCPSSNLAILGQTITPNRLRTLFSAGCLALGTDSRLSGAFDLLEELRVAARHSDFSPCELLRLVTVDAGRLLRTASVHNDVIIFRSHSGDPFADALRLQRHELRAVVRDGELLVADLDFEEWFVRQRIAYTPIQLDGHPKLCASTLLSPHAGPMIDLEPGLVC